MVIFVLMLRIQLVLFDLKPTPMHSHFFRLSSNNARVAICLEPQIAAIGYLYDVSDSSKMERYFTSKARIYIKEHCFLKSRSNSSSKSPESGLRPEVSGR